MVIWVPFFGDICADVCSVEVEDEQERAFPVSAGFDREYHQSIRKGLESLDFPVLGIELNLRSIFGNMFAEKLRAAVHGFENVFGGIIFGFSVEVKALEPELEDTFLELLFGDVFTDASALFLGGGF